ncbi:MAG: AAA family ATPase [Ktedonobacteraceae bacterium]
MKKHYLSMVKQYGWIILVCTFLAAIVGFGMVKIQKPVFQATSTMYVIAGNPGNTFSPTLTANDSIGLATNYAANITSRSVMEYVYQSDPNLKKRGYGPDDLLADVTTSPSATSSTFQVIASAGSADDAVLLANDVANAFQKYIQTQTQQQLDSSRKGLQDQYTAAQKQKSEIEAKLVTVSSNSDPHFTVYNAELNDILHNLDALQAQLIALPTTVSANVAVIQLASTKDATPVVKANLIIAITVGIGLLIGTLIMCLVIYLDNRLQSEEQVRDKLGMAYLGGISRSKALQQDPVRHDVSAAQELTNIGVNLRLLGILPDKKHTAQGAVLLITSAQVSEGKTTIATTLAATLASAGNSILVIDGNLQHPATHLPFGMSSSKRGLKSSLQSMANIEDAVQRTSIPGIWIICGGEPVSAPALLLEQKMPALLTHFREKVDVIIIDGPSLLSNSEASILAAMADGVALIVDARHDRLPLLLRAREVLDASTHVPVGVVMNYFPQPQRNHYYVAASPARPITEQGMSNQINASAHTSNGKYSDTERKAEPKSPLPQNILNMQATPFPQSASSPSRMGRALIVDPSEKK